MVNSAALFSPSSSLGLRLPYLNDGLSVLRCVAGSLTRGRRLTVPHQMNTRCGCGRTLTGASGSRKTGGVKVWVSGVTSCGALWAKVLQNDT